MGTDMEPAFELLDDEHSTFYLNMGYAMPMKINGRVCALKKFLFTTGILVGMDETGYAHRYCYHTNQDAITAYLDWALTGADEPTGYIKRKG